MNRVKGSLNFINYKYGITLEVVNRIAQQFQFLSLTHQTIIMFYSVLVMEKTKINENSDDYQRK